MVTPLPTKTKDFLTLLNARILDLRLTAGNPTFSDAHRMAARARIDELGWVRMMKSETTIIDDKKYCCDCGEVKDEVQEG